MSSEKHASPTDPPQHPARDSLSSSATDKTPRESVDGHESLSIGNEEELTWLDIETIDDLVYSFVFEKPEDDKKAGAGSKINSKLREKASNSENGKPRNLEGDFQDPKTVASDSGISSAETEGSLQAFLTEQSTLYYETPDHHPVKKMENKKNSKHEKVHMNGTAGQGPSGSRPPAPEIPGAVVDTNALRSDLVTAVEKNRVDKVRRILVSGVDPNAVCDTSGRWPLHVASLLGHAQIAKLLLDYGAQKDQPDTSLERAPLLYAAASSPETVAVLLNYRADIHARNKFGANALHYAAGAGQAECCKILASAGCDVNSRDRQKMTPLHMAARVDDIWSIEVLLGYGADIHAKDCLGKTALHHAAETAEGQESDYGKMGVTFRKLISAGITVNAIDNDGKTALYYAIETGSPDAVTILSDLGAELMDGISLLAMSKKFPALIRPFLDKCVSSNMEACDVESKHFYIQFDYTCLTFYPKDIPNDKLLNIQHREENESVLQETGVLHGLTRCKDTSILSHPVCESLLRLKWKKVKWYLYLDMLLFAVFLAFLTAVIFMEYESDSELPENLDVNGTMNGDPAAAASLDRAVGEELHESHRTQYCMDSTRNIVVWSILWFLTGCLGIREMIQLIQAPLHYVVQIENMLELVLVASVALLSLAECGVQNFVDARDHFAAVCLIVGWTIQVTLYGKIPVFGVYIRMFAAVAKNMLKCMFTYLGLLFAFSLTLHFLFRTHKEFDSVGFTFLKTFAMMIGEIELARTFIDKDKNTTIVPFTSHLMFALFIIFISVILMCLLQALAVNDISSMQREGEYMQLVQQVKVASQLEDALQHRSLLYPQFGMKDIRSIHQRKGVIFPNLKDHGKLSKDALEIVMTQHTKRLDANGIPAQKDEHSQLMRTTNEFADDLLQKLKNRMDKYAFDVERRSDKAMQDWRGIQERGSLQLHREVLLIKNLLEDMNTCLRELSITVKILGERQEESISSSRASISGGRVSGRRNNIMSDTTNVSSDTTNTTGTNSSPEENPPTDAAAKPSS